MVIVPNADCVGVDGAKRGWIAIWLDHESLEFQLYASARDLVASHGMASVIAVDVPIGLSDVGGRTPDALARAFVGGKRASSVFSAPVRGILDAQTQQEASRRHREIDGRGFGAQAFGILSKVREWDVLLQADPVVRRQVREIHPEVSFAALNGGKGLADRKKSESGSDAENVAARACVWTRSDRTSARARTETAGSKRRCAGCLGGALERDANHAWGSQDATGSGCA